MLSGDDARGPSRLPPEARYWLAQAPPDNRPKPRRYTSRSPSTKKTPWRLFLVRLRSGQARSAMLTMGPLHNM